MRPGQLGENVTVAGVAWEAVEAGVRLRIGEAVAEVTAFAAPCEQIGHAFAGRAFTRIGQKVNPGWSRVYVRILEEGMVEAGCGVELVPDMRE